MIAASVDTDCPPVVNADPLWLSLLIGRGMVVLASVGAFCNAAISLWGRVQPLVDDGISFPDAIAILNQAGPLLSASSDLWVMVFSAVATISAGVSRYRSMLRVKVGGQ